MIATKSTYCPKCFNMSLELKNSGKVSLYFDGKQKESSVFLFNLSNDTQEEINERFLAKINDFFKWYGGFGNKSPISKVEALSADFICTEGCSIDAGFQPSVVGILIDVKFFETSIQDVSGQFGVEID